MIKNLLKGLSMRPVSYYKVYKEVAGSTVGGIMLSQLVYWFTATNKDVIWKIDEDWVDELDLSDAEIRGGKSKLKELDFLQIGSKGVPAKTHYKIDWELLAVAVENGTVRMQEKKDERERKKLEKADKRANKAQELTVPLNSPNKSVPLLQASSADLTEPVPLNSRNKYSDNDGTLYKTEKTEENITEREENSENLHSRCDISIEKGKEHDENLRYRFNISVKKVVDYLNLVLKADYKVKNKHVESVFKQGFSVEEMCLVIDKKHKDWFNSDQEQYLRPSTLFGDKFEEYLNAESKESRLKREKFAENLFKKFKDAVPLIKKRNLEIKDLEKLTSNFNDVYSKLDMQLLSSYDSIKLLLSLFTQEELELDLKKRSVHVCP